MPPKPRKLHRGERLDLYPATLPRDLPPPMASEVIADSAHEVSTDDTREISAEIIADEPTAANTSELSTDGPLASTSHFPPAPTFHFPPAPTSHLPTYHFPPTYFFGWLYGEDDFYGRFANKDDEDAWDIYEGWKEMVTRPFRARYRGMSVPDFDIEDESKECIVYIAYNLEGRSRARAQEQTLIVAAKDMLGEAREPMWYRRL